jgi:hypothetical protein
MRWPRLTIRRLMAAMALIGIIIGGVQFFRLRRHYLDRADDHARMAAYFVSSPESILYWEARWSAQFEGKRPPYPWSSGPPYVAAIVAHHTSMKAKYEYAARYPWLTVEPDPSEPE